METKIFSKEEISLLLKKDEERRRRDVKRRQEEILVLMQEQELDRQGKLWGEISISAMADEANGGNGARATDVEARLCADVRDFGIDPDTLAAPMQRAMLFEAWDIVVRIVGSRWGESGLKLFLLWLDAPLAVLCQEQKLPAASTMELIKSMVVVCRREAGRKAEFPFPLEEEEIRKAVKRLNNSAANRRLLAGQSQPADPDSRVYLTPEEKGMKLDTLWQNLTSKGHQVSRPTVWRAKKTGWFSKPGWKHACRGQKMVLTEDEKNMPASVLKQKLGVSQITAANAKKRGYFYATMPRHLAAKEVADEKNI